jgi:hypothetical protein
LINDPMPEVMEFIKTFKRRPGIAPLEPEVMEFIKTFKRRPGIAPLDQSITPAKFITAFSKVHENKASSASGRHTEHCKAAATTSKILSRVHPTKMNMAFKYGTALQRWSTVVNIVTSKEGKIPRQHRIRIIQKLEADANQSLLIAFTKPITHQIDKHNVHHQSQYADHQQQCTSAVLYKDLQYEYTRISKSNLAWMETDCTGFYDRIIPNTLLMKTHTMRASKNSCIALGKV